MFPTFGEVYVNVSVAFPLTSITTYHTFIIEVHHGFPLALWVAFCLAIASDCKFFHITPKFYVYLTTAPGGNKRIMYYLEARCCAPMVTKLSTSTTKIRKESEKNE